MIEGLPSVLDPNDAVLWAPGPQERPLQAVILCLARPLAGLGTSRHLAQAASGLRRTLPAQVALGYVGPVPDVGADAPDPTLSAPWAVVEPSGDTGGTYRTVQRAMLGALRGLARQGRRRVAVLCMGYTAMGPEAVHRAVAALRSEQVQMEATVFVVDSAYPDTDRLDDALDEEGWPLGRFHGSSYVSTPSVRVVFLLTSAYGFQPACLALRRPPGMEGVAVITPPYAPQYVRFLEETAASAQPGGRESLYPRLPGLRPSAMPSLLVPIVSSDIWDPGAVGAWMSEDEYRTVTIGTRAMFQALVGLARQSGRQIIVPLDKGAADFHRREPVAGVALAGETGGGTAPVRLVPYRGLTQRQHATLLAVADFAIGRTGGQANATVVLALSRTPLVVMDMPAAGYMQTEITSLCMTHEAHLSPSGQLDMRPRAEPLGWRVHWSWSVQRIQQVLSKIVADPAARVQRAQAAYVAFHALYNSAGGSLFRLVESLCQVGDKT